MEFCHTCKTVADSTGVKEVRNSFKAVDHLTGPVVKASALRVAHLGLIPAFPVGIFPGQVIPAT